MLLSLFYTKYHILADKLRTTRSKQLTTGKSLITRKNGIHLQEKKH